MRIFNEDKTIELNYTDINYELGYLKEDVLVTHHDAKPEVKEVAEVGHYITVKEYPNGGKDVEWIVDTPKVEYQAKVDAYDEKEEIQVYKLYTKKELEDFENKNRMIELKNQLASTDYKAIKYAEGYYTEEEYKPIKLEREKIREEIRKLELLVSK